MRKRALMHGFMLTACLAYGQAPPSKSEPPDFTGVMEGTVFRSDGTPLRNVSVTALPQSNSAKSMNALTDSDGKFTIKDVEPGRYKLEATRANFVRRCYGQLNVRDPCVTLTVGPRQHLELLDIRMQPSAVIAGRIVDDHDEAVVGARVAALRWGYLNGHKDLLVAGLSVTDDRGQYRVHQLLPGNYYLAATLAAPGASVATMQTVASLVRCGEGLFVCSPSYYPWGSPDLAGAEQVRAAAGDELLNTNFRMLTTGGVRVSGTLRSPYSNVVGRHTAVRLIAKLHTTFGDAMYASTDEQGNAGIPGAVCNDAVNRRAERCQSNASCDNHDVVSLIKLRWPAAAERSAQSEGGPGLCVADRAAHRAHGTHRMNDAIALCGITAD